MLFPDLTWGYEYRYSDSAVDMDTIQGQGDWRIFSKMGAGYSTRRNRGEILSVTYAAFPVLESDGEPRIDAGHEFISHTWQ